MMKTFSGNCRCKYFTGGIWKTYGIDGQCSNKLLKILFGTVYCICYNKSHWCVKYKTDAKNWPPPKHIRTTSKCVLQVLNAIKLKVMQYLEKYICKK